MTNRARRSVALVLAAMLVGMGVLTASVANAADATPAPSAATGPTVELSNGNVAVGDQIRVFGTGWPASSQVAVTTCGNYSLNLSADCDLASQATGTVGADGTFVTPVKIGRPPTPCPCVIRVSSQQTNLSRTLTIGIPGLPTGTPTQTETTRSLKADVAVSGTGPVSAWFGGSAKRDVKLTVTNTGTTELLDPIVTIFGGRGDNPTDVIAAPKLGRIAAGQTITYDQEISLPSLYVGKYRVRAVFTDVTPIVNVSGTTSSYPLGLIVVGWLLLQIPLLGLYKRRPVLEVDDEGNALDDPFAPAPAPPSQPGADDPLLGGFDDRHLVGVGAAAAAGYSVALHQPRDLVPAYRPVFGVTDLRAYLDPGRQGPVATAAPRIVIGGVVPLSLAPPADPAT